MSTPVEKCRGWGRPRGRVVKFMSPTLAAQGFAGSDPGHGHGTAHVEVASHMTQLEGPTTKNIQLCSGGLWGEKEKIKIFKKYILEQLGSHLEKNKTRPLP